MNVITYQAPNGDTIDLTPEQVAAFEAAGTWPRNSDGQEYCSVTHGLHRGIPAVIALPDSPRMTMDPTDACYGDEGQQFRAWLQGCGFDIVEGVEGSGVRIPPELWERYCSEGA